MNISDLKLLIYYQSMKKMKEGNKSLSETIRKETIECVESLTTHGLPNLSRTKYTFIKIMWLVLTISSAGVSVYFITETLSEYAEYSVTTEVRLINSEESLEFPTISICNKNRFSTNYSIDLVNDLIKSKYNRSFEDYFHSTYSDLKLSLLVKSFLQDNDIKYIFSNIEINEREKFTLSLKDSLINCRFMDQNCSHLDFEWFFNSKYGNCYKFNANGLKNSTNVYKDNGLIIELFLNHPKELDILDYEKGLFVSIDSKNLDTYFDLQNLLEISTGLQTSIKIQKSLFKRYPKPYSNCDFRDGSIDSLTSEQKELYNEIINANLSYSNSFCKIFCRQKLIYQKFSCKLRANSLTVPNIKYCNTSKDYLSYSEREDKYRQSATDSCIKTCPIECETIKYDTDIFITKYPEIYLKHFHHLPNKKEKTIENFLVLKIFYGSMNFMSYKESPSMTVFELISNLGGTLGLFLGKYR